jgi:hypothetical protein
MAYTTLLGLIQPVTGSLTNTWGTAVNNQLTQLIEDSIAGYSTNAFSSPSNLTWTLSTTGGGAAAEYRSAILIATGTPGATCTIYAPKQSKAYVVINNFTDGSSLTVCGGPTSPTTGVPVSAGSSALVAWNDSTGDFVKVAGGGGGATGGGNDAIFFENGQTVTTTYTVPATTNAGTFGPVSIDAGVVVTVPSDSSWTVV